MKDEGERKYERWMKDEPWFLKPDSFPSSEKSQVEMTDL